MAAGKKYLVWLVFLVYLATAVLATYPLVKEIDQKAPFDLGDPLFMSWLVSWNNHVVSSPDFSLAKLFNTNIYYPYKNTLAYSDLMLVPSLMVLPVYWATQNPLITVNALLILLLAASAWAMFMLARHLTGNFWAALAAGFFYTFSTFHLAQIGHIQLHADVFFVLMLLFLHKWLDNRKPRHFLAAAAMLVLEALSSWYYAIYAAMLLLLFVGYWAIFRRLALDKRALATLAAGGLAAGIIAYPFIAPYLQLHRSLPNFERNISEAAFYSADVGDYIKTVPQNLVWGRLAGQAKPGVEDILFPGLAVLSLAAVGSAGLARSIRGAEATMAGPDAGVSLPKSQEGRAAIVEKAPEPGDRTVPSGEIKLFYLIVAWVAFILSFGPYKTILGRIVPLPFLVPFKLFPGFKAMRVPSRLGVLVLLGLCILAAYGLDRLMRLWLDGRGRATPSKRTVGLGKGDLAARPGSADRRRADVLAALGLAFIVLQQIAWPIPLSQPIASGNRIPPIYKWLAAYKGANVILELPSNLSEQPKYVYYSAYHRKRLINGYSGYTPPLWLDLEKSAAGFPSATAVGAINSVPADGILVHSALIPDWQNHLKSPALKRLRLVKKIGGDYFFRLARTPVKTRL